MQQHAVQQRMGMKVCDHEHTLRIMHVRAGANPSCACLGNTAHKSCQANDDIHRSAFVEVALPCPSSDMVA